MNKIMVTYWHNVFTTVLLTWISSAISTFILDSDYEEKYQDNNQNCLNNCYFPPMIRRFAYFIDSKDFNTLGLLLYAWINLHLAIFAD